ncbi:molybdopterin molybdotransferase MoeA [Paeniglutamicibacter antarcticus]|uniref:Molybdopterin molybdenumtransferase n=1 Tax=Arthrobacter terrae TaxID=2935737 RepID=A0A931CN91_9MICC|nr:gephyrin-like molybdotransferase Glp [Arthrobacter terrae]MBG0739295.1 molybdopterin molybdotransferase MoeA [Arthrobacter terrae]
MRRTVAEHQLAVLSLLSAAWDGKFDGGTPLPLIAALGRVAADDVLAPLDLPPFANSQMDGFAVNSVDVNGPDGIDPDVNNPDVNNPDVNNPDVNSPDVDGVDRARGAHTVVLTLAAAIPAGAVPAALLPGQAAPIMTGAMLPDGADAVVPVELAIPPVFPDASPGSGQTVALPATAAGTFVRAAGSDVRRGERVIKAGTRLTAGHLGLAAALGLTTLSVRRQPRVLLLTTGDEVVLAGTLAPGTGLPAGKIYDANSMLLQAALLEAGAEVLPAGLVPDDPALFLRTVRQYLATGGGVDAIVTTGGISAGAYEVVRQGLAGEQVDFLSVAMQPGGPQGLGTFDGVPFLGFPGNPVSGVMSVEMFLRPALTELIGAPRSRIKVLASLTEALTSPPGKHQIRRAVFEAARPAAHPTVRPEGGPSSHLLGALAASNALIHVPAEITSLAAGAEVEVWLL